MQKCPNCGQTTTRTEDWACQWCGHPLLSSSYKKIPKTYKQVKEEKLYQQQPPAIEEPVVSPPPIHVTLPPTHIPEAEAEPEIKPEPVVEPELEPVLEVKPEAEPEPEPEPVVEPEPEPVLEVKPEAEPEPKPEPIMEPEPEPRPEPNRQIMTTELEITVEELLSAYEADGVAADAKFANKVLKMTGVVDRIEVKDILDIHYITLRSAERTLLQTVRCVFDKKYADELNQLTPGQTVTVQGTYDGSIIDIRMRDCVLVH